MTKTCYKFLRAGGRCVHATGEFWSLPTEDGPGEWMPHIKELVPCLSGYHLCRERDLSMWISEGLYAAEVRGDVLECADKIVCHEARLVRRVETWNKRTARLFACDCAEHVLPIVESRYPLDGRSRDAIEAARRFANGEVTEEELYAAYSAAYSAAHSAYFAAYSAAYFAAYPAAYSAAHSAAHSSAHSSAYSSAERAWQSERIMQYVRGEVAND